MMMADEEISQLYGQSGYSDEAGLPLNEIARGKKRRKYSHHTTSNEMGEGTPLAHLRHSDLPGFHLTSTPQSVQEQDASETNLQGSQEWETADRNGRAVKKCKKIPKRESSNYPSITFSSESRLQSQIRIGDLQGLVLYIMADGPPPQWISVRHRPEIRKVVVLMVPGLERDMFIPAKGKGDVQGKESPSRRFESQHVSPDDYYPVKLSKETLPKNLTKFADMFEQLWPVKTPGDEKFSKMHSPLQAMLSTPLSKSQTEKLNNFRKGARQAHEPHGWHNERTRVTQYLSHADELLENEYVLHPASYSIDSDRAESIEFRKRAGMTSDNGWVDTRVDSFVDGFVPESEIQQGSITAGREILAMDCEMCLTGESELALTRISLVGWDGSVIMDELVKPEKPITDYVTMYSGITEDMLRQVTTTLQDIQQRLLKILNPKTILVGHSLDSDLKALKITHPFIIDTALIYPHPRGPPFKSSLKWLAQKYLNREIQRGHGTTGPGAGHDSIEDARTCLDLVRQKCEKGPEWGTSETTQESLFKRLARTGVRYKNQGGPSFTGGSVNGKTSAAIDWGDPKKGAGGAANVTIGCRNDEDVVRGVIRAIKGDPDGAEVRGGGVDFVWGRLRELESLKGWWNNNKQVYTEAASASLAQSIAVQPGTAEEQLADRSHDSSQPGSLSGISSQEEIDRATALLTARLYDIYESLPPCTAFIVFSGSGDPRTMSNLQGMQQTFKREFKVKKWDQLSVKWTDVEEQALKKAARQARDGIGFICVK